MTVQSSYVRWFKDLRLSDVPLVGGKNASLGELYSGLAAAGVRVPNGFALTAEAYREALTAADAWHELRSLLFSFDYHNVDLLAERASHGAAQVKGPHQGSINKPPVALAIPGLSPI